ncbi:putative plc-like phosphodiesterase [Erysiphe neolycopersici]|uniref:Putative plc-like phosphodiesterase n=1 Tax=Erysiphe neolycopersici TaxID=212602 RepID=A0A420HI02_9PEZI|nr:putative plc-like phosphodiesterase [Erysiphe neolycopersici]
MNLPGTHDSQTWNYSTETRNSLKYITRLRGSFIAPAKFYRCQEIPLISMLDEGIRVFDLRFAFDVTKTRLVFWHAQALQSQTASVSDVLFAFSKWLDDHPSEVIFVSLKYENSTTLFARYSVEIQKAILHALTSKTARKYFMGARNELGTLGDARGKMILLRRFDLDQLPPEQVEELPGIYFPTVEWTRNGQEIVIVYNRTQNHTAYIEDYYHISNGSLNIRKIFDVIKSKYEVTIAHLEKAVSQFHDHLFWTFTSGERNVNLPPHYPKVIALGKNDEEGMNQKLTFYFQSLKGSKKRLGIVMFDFSNNPPELIKSFLEIQKP